MATHIRNSKDRLSSALSTLNEFAVEERQEIKDLFAGRFEQLKKVFLDTEKELGQTLGHTKDRFKEMIAESGQATKDTAKQIGKDVNARVHESPWPVIGIAAATGILAGFFIASRNSK